MIRPPVYPPLQTNWLPPTPPLSPLGLPVGSAASAFQIQPAWLPPSSPLSPVGDSFTPSSPALSSSQSPTGVSQMDSLSPVSSYTLANGATGHFMQMRGQQKSMFSLMLPIDALSPGIEGLLSDVLEEGSEGTKRFIARLRDQDMIVGFSRLDNRLWVHGSSPVGQEPEMLKSLLTLLTRPAVDSASFSTLQAKSIANEQGRITNPDILLATAMLKQLYGANHTFALEPRQRMTALGQLDLPGLMAQHNRMLQAVGKAQAIMISPLPPQAQRQVLDEAIREVGWFRNPYVPDSGNAAGMNLPNPQGAAPPVLVPNESLKRALVKTIWKMPDPHDPDYAASLLIQDALRGTSTGSFFQTLRTDHGLVYGVAQAEGKPLGQGLCYNVGVEVDFGKIGQALDDLGQVTRNLAQSPMTPAMMDTLKRKSLLNIRDMFQMPQVASIFYFPWLKTGTTPPDLNRLQASIEQVTPQDIQRVASRIFLDPSSGFQLAGVSAPSAVLRQWFPGRV